MYYPMNVEETYGLFAVRLGKYKAHFYTRGSTHHTQTVMNLNNKC